MNEKDIINSVQAYALDSLSIEKKKQFKEYLETDDADTAEKLGEYLNLTAMLPSFLDLDNPSPDLLTQLMSDKKIPEKEEVQEPDGAVTAADDKKMSREEKIRSTIQNTLNKIEQKEDSGYTVVDEEDEFIHDETSSKRENDDKEEGEVIKRYSKLRVNNNPETERKPEPEPEFETEPEPEEPPVKSSLPVPADFYNFLALQMSRKQKWKYYITTYLPLIISVILLILLIVFYIGFTSQIDELQNPGRVAQENSSGSQDLMSMFLADAEKVELANLESTENYPGASGKLLLNPDEMNGLLQLNNLNKESNVSYRMWTGSIQSPIPLGGILYAESSTEFYPVFNIPDTVLVKGMMLFITKGKSAGTALDPETIYLTGEFNIE